MWRGAWEEAERELTSACDELAICRPGMTTDGLARLGELRRRQGRLDEAASLFERSGAHPIASLGPRRDRARPRDDRGAPRSSPSGICGGCRRRTAPSAPPRWSC